MLVRRRVALELHVSILDTPGKYKLVGSERIA
ncbi:MAG: hypothetical protein JWM43_7 [Acidobacteriaceae bacterium]|nr:hypothetical protein [Acidobacteriaceae bacterium]